MMNRRNLTLSFAIIGLICVTFLASNTANAQTLRIFHIDVDQGDATLIVAPNGNSMLIDSGKNNHGDRLRAAMTSAGVSQIDHLVITHYHEDHYGGADELITDTPAITVVNVHDRGDKTHLKPGKTSEDSYIEYETALGHRAHEIKSCNFFLGVRFDVPANEVPKVAELNQ